jgi:hypothetical protein
MIVEEDPDCTAAEPVDSAEEIGKLRRVFSLGTRSPYFPEDFFGYGLGLLIEIHDEVQIIQ